MTNTDTQYVKGLYGKWNMEKCLLQNVNDLLYFMEKNLGNIYTSFINRILSCYKLINEKRMCSIKK